jgi:hypothetical protein
VSQSDPHAWWELHLRQARGESLSEEEQRFYDAEIARQDREASPLKSDLGSLKKLRAQVCNLPRTNAQLRARLVELETQMQNVEQSLSQETREALGAME